MFEVTRTVVETFVRDAFVLHRLPRDPRSTSGPEPDAKFGTRQIRLDLAQVTDHRDLLLMFRGFGEHAEVECARAPFS